MAHFRKICQTYHDHYWGPCKYRAGLLIAFPFSQLGHEKSQPIPTSGKMFLNQFPKNYKNGNKFFNQFPVWEYEIQSIPSPSVN